MCLQHRDAAPHHALNCQTTQAASVNDKACDSTGVVDTCDLLIFLVTLWY